MALLVGSHTRSLPLLCWAVDSLSVGVLYEGKKQVGWKAGVQVRKMGVRVGWSSN